MRHRALPIIVVLAVLASVAAAPQKAARPAEDPVVAKIIELGTKDNRVMEWVEKISISFSAAMAE